MMKKQFPSKIERIDLCFLFRYRLLGIHLTNPEYVNISTTFGTEFNPETDTRNISAISPTSGEDVGGQLSRL